MSGAGGTPSATTPNWRALAWALLPPVAVLLLRAALQAQTDEATASLHALQTATQVATPGEAMWAAAQPFVLTLIALVVLLGAVYLAVRSGVRRHGWACVRPWVQRSWLALCMLAAMALVASHLNRTGRQTLPVQQAQVLLVRAVLPSERSVGGSEVYLQLPGDNTPVHLLAEGQPANIFPPKSTVSLQTEAGRWWGRWGVVTPLGATDALAVPAEAPPVQGPGG
jgi:hypothetical protein